MAVLLTINGTVANGNRIGNALAIRWGYSPFLADGVTPNPETKLEFVKKQIIKYLISEASHQEAATAAALSGSQVDEEFRINVVLT